MRSKGFLIQSFKREEQELDKNGLSSSQPRETKYKTPKLIGYSIGNSCRPEDFWSSSGAFAVKKIKGVTSPKRSSRKTLKHPSPF